MRCEALDRPLRQCNRRRVRRPGRCEGAGGRRPVRTLGLRSVARLRGGRALYPLVVSAVFRAAGTASGTVLPGRAASGRPGRPPPDQVDVAVCPTAKRDADRAEPGPSVRDGSRAVLAHRSPDRPPRLGSSDEGDHALPRSHGLEVAGESPRYTDAPRGCGGIGRRARFRSVCPSGRGGSSPLIRIA